VHVKRWQTLFCCTAVLFVCFLFCFLLPVDRECTLTRGRDLVSRPSPSILLGPRSLPTDSHQATVKDTGTVEEPNENSYLLSPKKVTSIGTWTGADLTGGHSWSGRRGPWEAGPWRPPGLGGPGRLNFVLQLQSPDWNLI